MFFKKRFLKNFAKFKVKHLCQSLVFFAKLQTLACNSIKKGTLAQAFSCEFGKIFKSTFFTGHLWATISATLMSPSVSLIQHLLVNHLKFLIVNTSVRQITSTTLSNLNKYFLMKYNN